MPIFILLIAPGFTDDGKKLETTIYLTRITFPFLLFVSLSSFFSAILNSFNKFAIASAAPIILNIFLIFTLIYANYLNDSLVYYLSFAVTAAGIVQLVFLIFFTKNYYIPKFSFKIKFDKKIKFFFKKLIPSIFSSGVTQINILVGTIIASFQASAVSYLYYADRIYQINLAIAGIAVGTVALPSLAKSIKSKDQRSIDTIQNKSVELSLLLSVPATFGLFISSKQIVNCLFGYGSFDSVDVIYTSLALTFFAIGVPAFALIKVLSNFYFARDNTKLPFYVSFITMIINIVISVSLFKKYGFIIIPIATSISTWVAVLIYFILLNKNKFINFGNKVLLNFFKILVATLFMSLFLYFGLDYFEDKFEYSYKFKLIYLLIMIGLSAAIYLFLTRLFGILNLKSYKLK